MLRFGLVGTSYWADVAHAAGIEAHPQAELAGVWGRDPAKAAALAAKHGVRAFGELDELIAAVDAVASRSARRAGRARAAGGRGRQGAAAREAARAEPRAGRAAGRRGCARRRSSSSPFGSIRASPPGIASRWTAATGTAQACYYLASIFEPGNPFGHSAWRRERGGLWDLGPHALSALLPALGKVDRVAAVRGPRDQVHLALAHESGAASSVALSLRAPADVNEVAFWNAEGLVRRPEVGEVDVVSAYGAAIDALLAGETAFDARFGLEVVRVLAAAEHELSR